MNKTILYYTCNTHAPAIDEACRRQLLEAGPPIVAVSLNKPLDFGDVRLTVTGERSPVMMHWQILHGLQRIEEGAVFLCESDVLYHPSHFGFEPIDRSMFYFNTNVYKYWAADGLIVWTDNLQQISGLCAEVGLLREFMQLRIEQIDQEGFNRHYEPGARYGCRTANWQSEFPNLDIRHRQTLTKSHRSKETFRNQHYAQGFATPTTIPHWGNAEHIASRLKLERVP